MIYPIFVMVVLTAVVLVPLFRSRVAVVRPALVSAAYFRIYQDEIQSESTANRARQLA